MSYVDLMIASVLFEDWIRQEKLRVNVLIQVTVFMVFTEVVEKVLSRLTS